MRHTDVGRAATEAAGAPHRHAEAVIAGDDEVDHAAAALARALEDYDAALINHGNAPLEALIEMADELTANDDEVAASVSHVIDALHELVRDPGLLGEHGEEDGLFAVACVRGSERFGDDPAVVLQGLDGAGMFWRAASSALGLHCSSTCERRRPKPDSARTVRHGGQDVTSRARPATDPHRSPSSSRARLASGRVAR
jgi:hypothetical protein